MSIATKNGNVILKNGSAAESCACCGDNWYCIKQSQDRCCTSLNISVTYSGLSSAAWEGLSSDSGSSRYGLTIVDAPTYLSTSGVATRSTTALDLSGCEHDCMYQWSRDIPASPFSFGQYVAIVQNLRVSSSTWISGLFSLLPLRFPTSSQGTITPQQLPDCCSGANCTMEIPHSISGPGYVAPSWYAIAPVSAWYQGCNYETIYRSDSGLLSSPLDSLSGQRWTLYLHVPQTACKSGLRPVAPVVGVTVEVL